MDPYWQYNGITLYHGHVLEVLPSLPAESVHTIVTSPPYWALRDYGVPPVEWPAVSYAPVVGLPEVEIDNWQGALGLEPTPEMFIGHIVLIWRELYRVLREDGTCWLNLGDSYSQDTKWGGKSGHKNSHTYAGGYKTARNLRTQTSLKPKDKVGIPWRAALALQADGWYLRSDIIWEKPNAMPESVRDRPTQSHEYLFLLAKSRYYYYDNDAIREPQTGNAHSRGNGSTPKCAVPGSGIKANASLHQAISKYTIVPGGRNRRTVWSIATQPYPKAHYAVFPSTLVVPCIKAGSGQRGCCPECGAAWERVIDKTDEIDPSAKGSRFDKGKTGHNGGGRTQEGERYLSTTSGWIPACTCYGIDIPERLRLPDEPEDASPPFVCEKCQGTGAEPALPLFPDIKAPCRKCKGKGEKPANEVWLAWKAEYDVVQANRRAVLENIRGLELPTKPCIILDPFGGAGTTAVEAVKRNRRVVLIELSQDYCDDHIIPRLSQPLQTELAL